MRQLAGLALAGLTLGLIGLGLAQVGGPTSARAELRDEKRLADLDAVYLHLVCLQERGLPLDPMTQSTDCPAPGVTDPSTGAPYRVDLLGDRQVRLCASFETSIAQRHWRTGDHFVPETGCMVFDLPEPIRPAP